MIEVKEYNITKGIIYCFACLLLFFGLHIAFYSQAINDMAQYTRIIYNHPLVVSNAAQMAHTNIIKMHRNMKDAVLFWDTEMVPNSIAEVASLEQETYTELRLVQKHILGEQGRQLVTETERLFAAWAPIRQSVIDNIQNKDWNSAAETTRGKGALHVQQLEEKMRELNLYARTKATGFLNEMEQKKRSTKQESTLLLSSWILLSFLLAFFTIRRTRLMEKTITEEREKLNVTIQSIGEGVIVTDTDGYVTIMNPIAETLTGWQEAEAQGKQITTVFNIVREADRTPCKNPVERVLKTKSIIGLTNHTMLLARNGTERAIGNIGSPLWNTEQDTVIGVVLVFRDQTEERRRQRQLAESERKYRLLSDNSLDLIWTMNLDYEFTYVSAAIEELTGYGRDEWLGSMLQDHCDQDTFSRVENIVSAELVKGAQSTGVLFEMEFLKKDGSILPVEIRARVIYDTTLKPQSLQGMARDISERKLAQEKSQHQAMLLQQMAEIAKIGAWEYDPITKTSNWTDEVFRIHDLRSGQPIDFLPSMSLFHGQHRKTIEQAIETTITNGTPFDLELQFTSAEGQRKWIRTIGTPVIEKDQVKQVRGALQDVTEQTNNKRHIEHLNRVLQTLRRIKQLTMNERDPQQLIQNSCQVLVDNHEYSCAIITLTDQSGCTPYLWGVAGIGADNHLIQKAIAQQELPPCCRLDSQDEAQDTLLSHLEQACPDCPITCNEQNSQIMITKLAHADELYGLLTVTTQHKVDVAHEEISIFKEMASDLALALHALRLHEAQNEASRNQKILETQLVQAQKMESIGRLAGGVAHDFNNMLNIIQGFSQLALEQISAEDEIHDDLLEINTAAQKAADITRQLLAFARKQTVSPQAIDLNEAVESLLKMLRRLIGEDIDLAWLPEGELWDIHIDPSQIDQVLANLCLNARDAIEDVGKITIETENITLDENFCALHSHVTPGDYVMLAVSDDGIGMDEEVKNNIFEPFFTTKELSSGTGLGMATVYGIVKQNNGFTHVYSEPGKGATIKIYFPRFEEKAMPIEDVRDNDIPAGHGEHILVVEDNPSILRMCSRILNRLDYTVTTALGPDKALEFAHTYQGEIHLLLTDVVMPVMNGRDLAIQLSSMFGDLKVLYMSGYTANIIAHRGVLEKGVHFMPKPFSDRILATKVREAIEDTNNALRVGQDS